jgi:hypothetical protein
MVKCEVQSRSVSKSSINLITNSNPVYSHYHLTRGASGGSVSFNLAERVPGFLSKGWARSQYEHCWQQITTKSVWGHFSPVHYIKPIKTLLIWLCKRYWWKGADHKNLSFYYSIPQLISSLLPLNISLRILFSESCNLGYDLSWKKLSFGSTHKKRYNYFIYKSNVIFTPHCYASSWKLR